MYLPFISSSLDVTHNGWNFHENLQIFEYDDAKFEL